MLIQALDFQDESDALFDHLKMLDEKEFETITQFKSWTINDILAHLHYYNYLAFHSLNDEDRFVREYGAMKKSREDGETIREATDRLLKYASGPTLLKQWHEFYPAMAQSFAKADPKKRVKWGGPDMSVRSSITARLMETWAHGQAIYDILGQMRLNTDRIRNIAVIGINTFGWSFINRGEKVPSNKPYICLTAPSGDRWEWNQGDPDNRIEGQAEEFCQVVTQTRNIQDTSLLVTGGVANRWMAIAQCFAGVPNDPPIKGSRYRKDTD